MSASCPKCSGNLTGSGLCLRCGYSSAPLSKTAPVAAPRMPAPNPVRPVTPPSAPTPPSYSVPPASSAAPPPATYSYSGPPPQPFTPAPYAAAAASVPAAVFVGALGQVRFVGKITEVSAERVESVGLEGANAMRSFSTGMLTIVPRAIGFVLGLLFAPLRLLMLASVSGLGRRSDRPDSIQVPVTPFVVEAKDGVEYDCIIRGEVRGGFLKLGDEVEVMGRIDRSRVVRVSTVESLRTRSVTRGYVDPRARRAPFATVAGIILIIFVIIVLISVFSALASFGRS